VGDQGLQGPAGPVGAFTLQDITDVVENAIAPLRNDIATMKADITTMKGDITDLKTKADLRTVSLGRPST
jgi:hypothetical protein